MNRLDKEETPARNDSIGSRRAWLTPVKSKALIANHL
jgi:hypothetical protein